VLYEGHRFIVLPALVYMENPYRGRERQCGVTAPPSYRYASKAATDESLVRMNLRNYGERADLLDAKVPDGIITRTAHCTPLCKVQVMTLNKPAKALSEEQSLAEARREWVPLGSPRLARWRTHAPHARPVHEDFAPGAKLDAVRLIYEGISLLFTIHSLLYE
jgi:hypothetical protein